MILPLNFFKLSSLGTTDQLVKTLIYVLPNGIQPSIMLGPLFAFLVLIFRWLLIVYGCTIFFNFFKLIGWSVIFEDATKPLGGHHERLMGVVIAR